MEVIATIILLQNVVIFALFLWILKLEKRIVKANASVDELVELLRTNEP